LGPIVGVSAVPSSLMRFPGAPDGLLALADADQGDDGHGGAPLAPEPPPPSSAAPSAASASAASAVPGPASVAAAVRDAQANTKTVRSKAHNTMHAVARLLADPELLSQMRMLMLCTRPFALSNAECCDTLKGADNCQEQYTKWALWLALGQIVV
jgi:hypothetical protein